jgi:hypothetical protein
MWRAEAYWTRFWIYQCHIALLALGWKTNLKTGICIHKVNPKGISCDNPMCTKLPRSLTHDCKHCFQPGGGMEGQGGNLRGWDTKQWAKKPDIAAAVNSTNSPTPAMPTSSETNLDSTVDYCNLACAIIKEIPFSPSESTLSFDNIMYIAWQMLSTILDSGTTSNLIMDWSFFWTYSESSHVTVKTANHGSLPTSGQGTCVADLMLGNQTFRVMFTDCLHAPGAMINLLSIGHMLSKKWLCIFEHSPVWCQLKYQGESLGEIPMTRNLYFLDLKFIYPNASSGTYPSCELSAFVHLPLSWDL